jgi:hypothetical protein
LFYIGLFSCIVETHVSLERKASMLKVEHPAGSFPVRIELVFQRNSACPSRFSRGNNAQFAPNRYIQVR